MPEIEAERPILIADSITRVPGNPAGAVVVNASHGGTYAAYLAARLGVAAAIFNDASVGKDNAGISGISYLEDLGIPAATVDCFTACIGDGADMMRSGVLSYANEAARALGVRVGQDCSSAARAMTKARNRPAAAPEAAEGSWLIESDAPRIWALDSASMVTPEHHDAIVITGSHGGLLGGRPETALKYDTLGALFNDAGLGKDDAGLSRLPALDARGIPAATVAAQSARIGDARSIYEDGIISRVNEVAAELGLAAGMTAREFVTRLRNTLKDRTSR